MTTDQSLSEIPMKMYLLPSWQFLSLCYLMGCDPGSCRRPPTELSPIIHEVTALLEKIAAPIGRLDRVADGVGEGLLDNVVLVRSRLSRPISEGAAKAMDRHIASPHLLQHIRHGHVTKAGSRAGPNEHM